MAGADFVAPKKKHHEPLIKFLGKRATLREQQVTARGLVLSASVSFVSRPLVPFLLRLLFCYHRYRIGQVRVFSIAVAFRLRVKPYSVVTGFDHEGYSCCLSLSVLCLPGHPHHPVCRFIASY